MTPKITIPADILDASYPELLDLLQDQESRCRRGFKTERARMMGERGRVLLKALVEHAGPILISNPNLRVRNVLDKLPKPLYSTQHQEMMQSLRDIMVQHHFYRGHHDLAANECCRQSRLGQQDDRRAEDRHLLHHGAMTPDQIASNIEEKNDTIERTQRRHQELFLVLPDERVGLADRGP